MHAAIRLMIFLTSPFALLLSTSVSFSFPELLLSDDEDEEMVDVTVNVNPTKYSFVTAISAPDSFFYLFFPFIHAALMQW